MYHVQLFGGVDRLVGTVDSNKQKALTMRARLPRGEKRRHAWGIWTARSRIKTLPASYIYRFFKRWHEQFNVEVSARSYIWVNYNDRTLFSRSLESWWMYGKSSPSMAELSELFRWTWNIAGWWFGTFFICPFIGNNHPNWLIFFRGVGIPPTRL